MTIIVVDLQDIRAVFRILTCQRLIFRLYREPASRKSVRRRAMTSQQTTRDTYSSRQMATAYSFDVDTSNCKAMISMIKATRFFIALLRFSFDSSSYLLEIYMRKNCELA